MFYLVSGTVRSMQVGDASRSWLVDGERAATPEKCAAVVLAHCNRDKEQAPWEWATTPTVEALPDYVLPPGTWFLTTTDERHDQLAFLNAPPGASGACVLNIFVRPASAERNNDDIRQASVVLDMEGPLSNLLPVAADTATATARAGITLLMQQCGSWLSQLGQLMDTVALEDPTAEERARERVVLDELAALLAERRQALDALEEGEHPERPERVLVVGDDDSVIIAQGVATQLRVRHRIRDTHALGLSAGLSGAACVERLRATRSDVIVFLMYDSKKHDLLDQHIAIHPIFDALERDPRALAPARSVLLGPVSAAYGVSRQHAGVLDAVILGNGLPQRDQIERLVAILDQWTEGNAA